MVTIRAEAPKDERAIRHVNEAAFCQSQEADIVDGLRQKCKDLLSLVAVEENRIVAHIIFSPIAVEGRNGSWRGMALGPMAVLPVWQRRGIGSRLVRAGIEKLREQECPFVIVLGHPEYYARFGFEPASRYGIRCQWPAPDEAFMILVLDDSKIDGISGLARYRAEFAEE